MAFSKVEDRGSDIVSQYSDGIFLKEKRAMCLQAASLGRRPDI